MLSTPETTAIALPRSFTAKKKPCCRCGRRRVSRPRGLCWRCYYLPGVRDQFPPVSKYGRRGVGNGYAGYRLPDTPTSHPPGSPEKVAELERRAAAGRSLWHPDDAKF